MARLEDFTEVKGFNNPNDKIIERENMGQILEAGRNAPSPGRRQTLEFVVVEDEGTREHLANILGDSRVKNAPTTVVVFSDPQRMSRAVDDPIEACYAEASASSQNMRVMASSLGLYTNFMTGFDSGSVEDLLNAPQEKMAVAVVSFAYSDSPSGSVDRFGMNQMCYYDEYGSQVGSVFDGWEWTGYDNEKKRYGKKVRGLYQKISGFVSKRL